MNRQIMQTRMKTKPSLLNVIRRWAFLLLIALAAVLFAAYTINTIKESKSRDRQIRAQYLEKQRQIIKSEVVSFTKIIEHEMEKTLQEAKTQVQVRVLAAHSMAQNLYDQNKDRRTKTEIQKIIIDALRPIRLDQGGGYYFISDFNGIIKLSADRPDQESISLLERQDTRGRYVIKDMVGIAQSDGEGFYSYHWTKPGYQGNDFEKIAFVKRFQPFDWLIGTGLYLDDLESRMQKAILQYANTRRFGPKDGGYVFVYELLDIGGGKNFAMVYANPNLPDDTGELISDDYTDARGKPFRKEFLTGIRKHGECFVDYWYTKINDPEPSPKTSFFKLAGNGRFVVAAGLYLDDVEDQIRLMQADLKNQLQHAFLIFCSIFIAAVFIVLLLASLLNKRLENDFQVFADFFKLAASSSLFIDREKVKFFELDRLAAFANSMLSQKATTEDSLKKTQGRLTQAQEMAKLGHYIFDVKKNLWSNSPELDKIFGIDHHFKKDIAGWLQIVHPDFQETMSSYLADHVLTRHHQFNMEYKIVDQRTGQEKWVHGLGDLKFDETNEAMEMFGTIQDITERKQIDEALKASEEKYQSLFQNAQVALYRIRLSDSKLLEINERYARMAGYSNLADCMAKFTPADSWVNPNGPMEFLRILQANGSVNDYETQIVRRDGSRIWTSFSATIYPEKGFLEGSIADITERKKAEDALQQSEERLSGIVDSMADWTWEVDAEGRYLYCSQKGEHILGYSPGEMIGRTPFDFMAPDEAQKIRGVFIQAVAQKKIIRDLENWNICKDGRKICLLTNGVPIWGETGQVIGFRGVDKDITQQKQADEKSKELEARLQQAQKMEAIGTLAGGIAHDFNNILSGILGYSQLAIAHIHTPEKAIRHIKQIAKGTQRATDLTKQILTFSRQSEYQKQPFKIYIEIKEALKLIRSTIPTTIEIKTRIDSKKRVLADPIKIHQVIMNLCTNAYHAMRKTGGCLIVSLTDEIFTRADLFKDQKIAPGEYIKLEVSDTGQGMDEKTLEKAFEPYFTTKEKGDGTGLGLAIVQAIVDEHDGFLQVHSEIDKGTSFYLYFPIVKDAIKNDSADILQEPQLTGNETIMIVDDEDQVRESFKEFLEDFGYQVQTFRNGTEALGRFKANPAEFDFIITDMTMPGVTGDKLATELLKQRPELPIVLCSGFSENTSRAKAIEIGIRQYIQKPVLHKDLLALIRSILDKKG